MGNIFSITIDNHTAGLRLDKALALHPDILTRSRAAKLIGAGLVLLEGRPIKPSHVTRAGECFTIEIPIQENDLVPLALPLDIVFEDSDLLVVNKPAGLVVHPAEGHAQDTLVNALLHHTDDLAMGFNEKRPGIVHRLDRDTSGLLVVAKNDRTHEYIARQFRDRTVHRQYWAVVVGPPKPPSGRIQSQLARHPKDRKRFASIDIGGKTAITNYQTIKTFSSGLSLLHVRLETGRTHQIRIHMSELGTPVAGDWLYGPNQDRKLKSQHLIKTLKSLNRIALHAAEIGFVHPQTGQEMAFRASWPKDMEPLLEFMRDE